MLNIVRSRYWLASGLLLVLAVMAHGASSKPNFTGEWKLNVEKSDFGMLFAPKSATVKIEHKDPALKLSDVETNEQDETTKIDSSYTTDGRECKGTIIATRYPVKGTWKLEGKELSFTGAGTTSGVTFEIQEKWELSEDGKTIVISRHLSSDRGNTDQKIVLEK